MIDRILTSRGKDVFSDDYSPVQAVIGSSITNPEASRLAVIFRPWHGGGRITQALVDRLSRQSAVLDYELHDQILEPNIDRVPQSFETIRKRVDQDLRELVEIRGYQSVHLIGMSIGNVALALVARTYPGFSDATVVVGGDNLATLMWEGLRTQGIRKKLVDQGFTKDELDEAWQEIAPERHTEAFKDKNVKMVISQRDVLLPTSGQVNLRNRLQEAGALLSPTYTKLGHCATIAKFCLVSGKI